MKNFRYLVAICVLGTVLAVYWTSTDITQNKVAQAPEFSAPVSDAQQPVVEEAVKQQLAHDDLLASQSDTGDWPHSPVPKGFENDRDALAWAMVDLDYLRRQMPNNLYWALAAPTQDEAVLEERNERKRYWQDQFARINANRASEEEIRAYFAHWEQVSKDYVAFATALINQYGEILPEQARHFQIFARNLNLVQLQELPKKLTNALENRRRFMATREEWLQDKAAYEAKLAQEREAALRDLGKI